MGAFSSAGRTAAKMAKPLVALAAVLFIALAAAGASSGGMKTKISELWIKSGGDTAKNLEYTKTHFIGERSSHIFLSVGKTENTLPLAAGANGMLTKARLLEHMDAVKRVTDITVKVKIASSTKPDKMEDFHLEDLCADTGRAYLFQCQRVTMMDCFQEGNVDMPASHHTYLTNSVFGNVKSGVAAATASTISSMSAPVTAGTKMEVATIGTDGKIAAHLKKIGGVPGNDVENRKAMARALADAAIPAQIEATAAALAGAGNAATNAHRRTAIASTALDGAFSTGLACGATATQAQKTTGFNNFLSVAPGSAMGLGTITDANFADKRTAAITATVATYNQTDAGFPAVLEVFVAQTATSWGSSDAAYLCGRTKTIGGAAASFADAAAFAAAKAQVIGAMTLGGHAYGLGVMALDAQFAGGLKLAAAGARAAGATKAMHDAIANKSTAPVATKALVLAKVLVPQQIAGIAGGGGDAGKAFALASLTTDAAIGQLVQSTNFGNVVTASATAAGKTSLAVSTELRTKLVKGQMVAAGTCSGKVDSITATTVVLSSTTGTCADHSTLTSLKTNVAACQYKATVDEKVLALQTYLTAPSPGSAMASAVGGVGSITAATFAAKRTAVIQTFASAQGWATNSTKAAAYEKYFIETLTAGAWGASASKFDCAMSTGYSGGAAQFDASTAHYEAGAMLVAKQVYGTMWYGARPKLATATQDQILDAVSGKCQMWDDPSVKLLPNVYKELSVGNPTFKAAKKATTDAQGFEVPGIAAAPALDPWSKSQPYTTTSKGWVRTGQGSIMVEGARSVEAMYRTNAATVVKNRLAGLDQNGVPFRYAAPDGNGVLVGPQLLEQYSKRKAAISVTVDEAKDIIKKWEIAFADESHKLLTSAHSDTYFYSASTLQRMLAKEGKGQMPLIALGFILMLIYGFIACRAAHGTAWGFVGCAGSLMCGIAVAGGMGLAGLLGVKYNSLVLQLLPFLMLGIGVDDMFVVLQCAQEMLPGASSAEDWMAKTANRAGPSITLTTATNIGVFLIVTIVKIPVVVDFVLIAAVIAVGLFFCNLFVIPALCAIWWNSVSAQVRSAPAKSPLQGASNFIVSFTKGPKLGFSLVLVTVLVALGASGVPQSKLGLNQGDVAPAGSRLAKLLSIRQADYPFYPCTFSTKSADLSKPSNQMTLVSVSEQLGDLKNIMNGNPTWLHAFYNWASEDKDAFLTNTTTLANPGSTKTNELCSSGNAMTGGKCGPTFGCNVGLVAAGKNSVPALNSNGAAGAGLDYKHYHDPANPTSMTYSDPGTGGYTLCMKFAAGHPGNPKAALGTSWCPAIPDKDSSAGYDPASGFLAARATKGFAYCYQKWIDNDATSAVLAAGVPKSNAKCTADTCPADWPAGADTSAWNATSAAQWKPKSGTVVYSHFAFNAYKLNTNDDYKALLKQSKAIADAIVPFDGYTHGIPFFFWEQYMTLKEDLMKWIGIELIAVFVVTAALILSNASVPTGKAAVAALWGAAINTLCVGIMVVMLGGFMAWFKIKLSAIPAIVLWMSVAFGVEFTAHIMLTFLMSTKGSNAERVDEAMSHMAPPTLNGACSTVISLLPLLGGKLAFLIKYLVVPLFLLVLFAMCCGFVLLPNLLTLVGPPCIVAGGAAASKVYVEDTQPTQDDIAVVQPADSTDLDVTDLAAPADNSQTL